MDEEDLKEKKLYLMCGILAFYLINTAGLLIGLIAIEKLGNLKGIAFMLITLAVLQLFAGYVTLELSETL